jgi:hypothetical protein
VSEHDRRDEPGPTDYRRVLLDLHAVLDRRVMQTAAELARLLGIDLHVVFVTDGVLQALAEMPFARELRMPGHEWHPLAPDRVAGEQEQAIARARRMLQEVIAALGVTGGFEVRQGDPAELLSSLSEASDIVVVAESARVGERASGSHARRTRAAWESAASVLLLPSRVRAVRGAIAVVPAGADDPAVALAARIALRAGEDLVLLVPRQDATAASAQARRMGLPAGHVQVCPLAHRTETAIATALAAVTVRLLVLTRAALEYNGEAALSRLARSCGAPVLALESGARG